MKKKQIIAAITAIMCCMGTVSVPSMAMVSAEESASITAQTTDLDSIVSAISGYMTENGIAGNVNIYIRNGEKAVAVTLKVSADVEKIQAFVKEQNLDSGYISYFADDNSGEMLLEKEVHAINYAASISTYMNENNIKGYIYQKQDADILVIVCKTNENINSVKGFAKERGFKTELLEYKLPDFEVEAPATAPTDLEEIRQILDEFIKQNGLNGYTTIRPRKGEDKVWVMLDSLKDEYTRKIEYFLSEYGIALNSVIVDMEVTTTDDTITTGEQTSNNSQYAEKIESFMKQNNIVGSVYTRSIDGKDKIVVLCENYDDQVKVKDFVSSNGIDENALYYDFYTEENSASSQDINEYAKAIDNFMNEHNIAGSVNIRLLDGIEKIVILCEKVEEQGRVRAFATDNGIDESFLYFDYITENNTSITETDLNEYVNAIDEYMKSNGITGSVNIQKIDGTEMVVVLCNEYDEHNMIKAFAENKGFDENRIHYGFITSTNEETPPANQVSELNEYVTAIEKYMKQNSIAGSVDIQKIDGEDTVIVTCDEYDDHFKIKEYAENNGFDSTSIIYSFKTYNHIASDDEFAQWAIKDYRDKTGVTAASAEVTAISDEEYAIVLKDADGNILDTYTINPETGIGTDSSNATVNLPQTGNNSTRNLLTAIGAVLMIAFGAVAVKFSGVLNRRKRNEK